MHTINILTLLYILRKDNFFEKRQFYYLSPIQYIINKYKYPNKFYLRFNRYKYANS